MLLTLNEVLFLACVQHVTLTLNEVLFLACVQHVTYLLNLTESSSRRMPKANQGGPP